MIEEWIEKIFLYRPQKTKEERKQEEIEYWKEKAKDGGY